MRVTRCADGLLDAGLVVLATWTLVYHVALLGRLPSSLALVVEAVVLVAIGAGVILRMRQPDRSAPVVPPSGPHRSGAGRPRSRRILLPLALAATIVASVVMAVSGPWLLVWVPWLLAALAGVGLAVGGLRDETPAVRPVGRWEAPVVLAWALGLVVAAAWTLRPNPDDLFYINFSQWVADHGTFPLRDTLFSDLAYPAVNFPPVASYDGLVGALAHLVSRPAGDIAYLIVPPVAIVGAVLALWRLLRAWRVTHVALALSIGMVFLLFDGTSSYGPPGNLFVTRLWQGKVILLCIVVPLLLVHLLRYVERPTRVRAVWLALGGIASVALSTTAIFLVPLVALAGVAPLARRAPGAALRGLAATAAYPLLAGVVTIAVGGRSADDFAVRRLYRFEASFLGHLVFLTGVIALIGVAAALLGHLAVPHPAARVTSTLMALVVGLTYVPGATRVGYDLLGLGPTLWRLTWGLGLTALIGVGAAALLTRLPRPAAVGSAAVALALVVLLGHPIWLPDTSTRFATPPHWQRGAETRGIVARMLQETAPGAVVLVPEGLGVTTAVVTTEIKTVAPRTYALDGLRDAPGFDYSQRRLLQDLVNDRAPAGVDETRSALRSLDVAVACADRRSGRALGALRQAGYERAWATPTYVCLKPEVH